MFEKHFAMARSLAKILLETREQLARALCDAATAQLALEAPASVEAGSAALSRHALEPFVDDAVYALVRDGAERLEDNVRAAVDDIARAASDVVTIEGLRDAG